jgi:hypothetical protein
MKTMCVALIVLTGCANTKWPHLAVQWDIKADVRFELHPPERAVKKSLTETQKVSE